MFLPLFLADCTLWLNKILIFCLVNIFLSSFPKSLSIVGIRLSKYSIIVISTPIRAYIEAISTPITPPPIITMLFGFSGSESASVEVIILFLSISTPGIVAGLEPVAII
ncbi:hypothetical protein D3C85_972640 [compost metagenome]